MSDSDGATPGIISYGGFVIYGAASVFSRLIAIVSFVGYQALNILNALPLLIGVVLLGFVAFGWQNYHDEIMESTEYGLRCVVRPTWVDTVLPVYELAQRIYNPLICWWNAVNWIFFGLWRNVIFPLSIKCGIQTVVLNAGQTFFVFADTFVAQYFATGNFLTLANGVFDFDPLAMQFRTTWLSWQDLICCYCGDLCNFIKLQPLIVIVPGAIMFNPLALLGSSQIADLQFLCAIGNTFNGLINIVQQLFAIIVYLVSLVTNPMPGPFPRPDLTPSANFFCEAARCLVRSIENAAQLFVELYLPFPFNFIEFFCIVDTLFCILIKSVAVILKIFINIDQVVFHPTNTFYQTSVVPDFKEILNLYAPLRFAPWRLETTDPASPVFGQRRLTECVCIFIERLICDPSAMGTACFDPGAQEILGDFDFCCLFAEAITTVADVVAGLGEWSLNLYSSEAFFRFVDTLAYEALDAIKLDLVAIVDCVGKAFGIIPVVGWCLRNIVTQLAKVLGCLIVFFLKFIISILTVGFFAGVLMDGNWLTTPQRALNEFEAIVGLIVPIPSQTPEQNAATLSNAICCVLNRIPIPPLPCTNCNPGGWIGEDGVPVKRAAWGTSERFRSILEDEWNGDSSLSKLTPPLKYSNETKSGFLGFNPVYLREMITSNLEERQRMGLPEVQLMKTDIDTFVSSKKAELLDKFHSGKTMAPGEGSRARSLAEWSFRFQTAMHNKTSLHEFMPRGVNKIYRYDSNFRDIHMNKEGVMVGYNTRTGYIEPIDERILCMPTPTCFDLCCIFRNTLKAATQLLLLVARFLDGIIHGNIDNYEYFRGPGFEMDLRNTITDIINILQCLCDFIELVFPIPNLDLCCPIIKAGELINGILGVIINSIKSLALDPTFAYFTNGMFEADIDTLFNITLEIVVCLCDILRAILPIPGVDPCCLPQIGLFVIIEALRFVLQLIINLSTIETTGLDYFQNPDLNEVGLVKQIDVILDLLFGEPGGQCAVFFQGGFRGGTGNGGIVSCLCQVINLVIPARPCPGLSVGDPACPIAGNCPYLDLCCIFREAGFVLSSLTKFLVRLITSFWQPWVNGTPVTFLDFLFCDENATPFIQDGIFLRPNPLYKASCGKLEPTLRAIRNIVADCPCAFFRYIDGVLPGPGCFCGLNVGIFQAIPDLIVELIRQLLRLLRSFWSASYWSPPPQACGFSAFAGPPTSIGRFRQCSWALSFFGPIADRACTALISLTCFLDNLLMIPCRVTRQNLIGSLIVWVFEIIIRLVEIIEGLADVFANTCNQDAASVGGLPGTNTACLAAAIEGIFALPVDILIADALLPVGENDQLDRLLAMLPTCNGTPVSGIFLNIARYLSCTFFAIPFVGVGFGYAMQGLVIFLSIVWQILRKLIFVLAAFINLITSLFQLFSGANCACWGPERHQQGFGFAVGFCYRCLEDPCTTCGDPNGAGDCRGIPCCLSTEPAEPKVLCTFLGVIIAFFELVGAIFGIFDPPPVIPPTVTAKDVSAKTAAPGTAAERALKMKQEAEKKEPKEPAEPMSRRHSPRYRERAQAWRRGEVGGNATDSITLLFEGIVGYDVSDCPTDPVSCICRNYPTHMEGICKWDYVNHIATSEKLNRDPVTPDDVMHGMQKNCNGTSTCDWFVRGCAEHGWMKMSDTDKLMWTECINKHTAGSRIHDLAPVFPADFFTRQDGLLQLVSNFKQEAAEFGKREKVKWENSKATENEKQRDRNQGKTDKELQIDHFRRTTEWLAAQDYKNDIVRDTMARLDLIEFKLRNGMVQRKLKKAYWNIRTGEYENHLYPAIITQKDAIVDLGAFLWKTEWRRGILEGMRLTGRVFTDVGNGVRHFGRYVQDNGIWAANPITHYMEARAKWKAGQEEHHETAAVDRITLKEAFMQGPLYKWWNSPWESMRNPLRPFMDHLGRNWRINRNPDKYGFPRNPIMTIDERFATVKNALVKRWTPRWTPTIEGEWNKVLGVFYRMYDYIWPGELHQGIQEKFVFNCNCEVADRSLELVVNVVDYCLNDFMFNLPPAVRKNMTLNNYLERTSRRRTGFLRDRRSEWSHRKNSTIVWKQTNPLDPHSRIRPKIVHNEPIKRHDLSALKGNNWKRARMFGTRAVTFAASAFNIYTIVICAIEEALGLEFSSRLAEFFLELRDWILNPNTNPDDCPDDVGLLYWFTFFFRCEFPGYLNASNPCAVGLPDAVKYTFIVSLIVFGGASILFPAVLLPLTVVGAFVFYLVVIPAAAWHYSPQCWLIFPSIPIPGIGITVPILPFPIGLPVLPEPLLDDVKALLNDFLGPCPFQNFEGIVPKCLYNGDMCPACPERIDLANCVNVGIADGLSNIVYLAHWLVPDALEFTVNVLAQTCFLGGCFIPFLNLDFVGNIRDEIINAGPTQMCRQEWCFWATIISMPLPVVVIGLVGGFSIFLAGLIFALLVELLFFLGLLLAPIASGNSDDYDFGSSDGLDELNDRSVYDQTGAIGEEIGRRKRRKRKKRRGGRIPRFERGYSIDAELEDEIQERREFARTRRERRHGQRVQATFSAAFSEVTGPFWRKAVSYIADKEKQE